MTKAPYIRWTVLNNGGGQLLFNLGAQLASYTNYCISAVRVDFRPNNNLQSVQTAVVKGVNLMDGYTPPPMIHDPSLKVWTNVSSSNVHVYTVNPKG